MGLAKRVECDRLAGAVELANRSRIDESGSKLHALQTLRDIWVRHCRAMSLVFGSPSSFLNTKIAEVAKVYTFSQHRPLDEAIVSVSSVPQRFNHPEKPPLHRFGGCFFCIFTFFESSSLISPRKEVETNCSGTRVAGRT